MVFNGKVYLYTSHDEDDSTWFTMNDWRLYTTEDMVNWTDHGAVLSYKEFEWAKMNAWAPQCIERSGKFYMYVPNTTRDGKGAIGVAVADSPYGPFIDPLENPWFPIVMPTSIQPFLLTMMVKPIYFGEILFVIM